jgi:hypothetical protein
MPSGLLRRFELANSVPSLNLAETTILVAETLERTG